MIRVTKKQNEYLLQLADGPKTTRDLMLTTQEWRIEDGMELLANCIWFID